MAKFINIKTRREASSTVANDENIINLDAISRVVFHTVSVGPPAEGRTKTTATVFLGDNNSDPALRLEDEKEIAALRSALSADVIKSAG